MRQHPPFLVPCLLAVSFLCAACQKATEYVVPHPRHAEKSVKKVVTDVFEGLARAQKDIEKAFRTRGSEDKGRVFIHVRGIGIGPGLAAHLRRGMGGLLEDAGYEVVPLEELERSIDRQASDSVPSRTDRTARKAARALNSHEGAGALDVYVTSLTGLGLGEPNFEGKYEERLRIGVTATFYSARWGDEVFRDRATLTSRSAYTQAEPYYSGKVHGMSARERSLYRLLVERVRILLPRLPERNR